MQHEESKCQFESKSGKRCQVTTEAGEDRCSYHKICKFASKAGKRCRKIAVIGKLVCEKHAKCPRKNLIEQSNIVDDNDVKNDSIPAAPNPNKTNNSPSLEEVLIKQVREAGDNALNKFYDDNVEKLKTMETREDIAQYLGNMQKSMIQSTADIMFNIKTRYKNKDYSKYYTDDFEDEYDRVIEYDEREQFFNDLRAVLYRIRRGSRKFHYVHKLSKEEPASLETTYTARFTMVDKKGRKNPHTIDEVCRMAKDYGVQITYGRVVCKPTPLGSPIVNGRRMLNMFGGYKSKLLTKEALVPDELKKITPILNFLKDVICGGNLRWYVWLINWIRQALFNPKKKTRCYLLLLGGQGCGKSTLITWLTEYVIGEAHSAQISSLDYYFTRFNGLSQNLLLACFNEVPAWNGSTKTAEMIKTCVTDTLQIVEKKGIDPIKMKNYTNFIFASNHDIESIYMQKGDRRAAVLPIDESFIGDKEYFDEVHKAFTEENAAIFSTYVKYFRVNVDVTVHSNMPPSAKKETMLKCYQKSHLAFIDDIRNREVDLYRLILDLGEKTGKNVIHKYQDQPCVSDVDFYKLFGQYTREEKGCDGTMVPKNVLLGLCEGVLKMHKVHLTEGDNFITRLIELPKVFFPEEEKEYYDEDFFELRIQRILNNVPCGNLFHRAAIAADFGKALYAKIFKQNNDVIRV